MDNVKAADLANATFETGTCKLVLSAPDRLDHLRRSGRGRKKFDFSTSMILGLAAVVYATAASAEDMFTKAPPPPAATTPATCNSVDAFFLTNCLLSWYGVTVYGTIDVGVGWESHGAPFNRLVPAGVDYFLQKPNSSPLWLPSPNGLSQSTIGIKGNEPLAAGWSFLFDVEAGFDPYSLQFADGPGSVSQNAGLPTSAQTSYTDSNRNGTFYNALGYLGVSSPAYGTLTFFRQTSLTLDGVLAFDPMGGAYAFSPIGWAGTTCGVGDTETCRVTTAAKYNVRVGPIRAAALAQIGGYDQGNGSNGEYQISLGGDISNLGTGVLSVDGIYSYIKDGVLLSVSGTAPFPLTATISDNSSVMLLSKYTIGPVKLYAGYEWVQFAPPSDPQSAFTDISRDPIGSIFNNNTTITNTAYSASGGFSDKILQIMWTGAKYAVTDNVDVTGAYYHYTQNTFTTASCFDSSAHAQCSGTMDAFSAVVDWRFATKFDTYIGLMFSQVNGGLSNGYLARNNIAPTGGLRFRF